MHSTMTDRHLMAALGLSALLHLLAALMIQTDKLPSLFPQSSERSMEVEVVPEPPKPPIPAPRAMPEPPPEPPKPQPTPPQPLQHPQLQQAPLAEKSAAPRPSPRPEPPRTEPGQHAKTSTRLSLASDPNTKPAQAAGNLSQSIQDKILAQVLRMWHFKSSELRGSNAVLSAELLVNQDGTLAGLMHKDAPWNPGEVIAGYSALPEGSTGKRVLETFLLALRMSQPLQLPPDDGKPWPRRMLLRFKPGDL